jgi:hypothetical protein
MPEDQVSESLMPPALNAEMDRAARATRILVAVAAIVLVVHCLTSGNGKTGTVLSFWAMSFYVFPSSRIAGQLRLKPYAIWAVLLVGLVQMGIGLSGVRARVPSMGSLVFLGVTLMLSSWANLLYVRTRPRAKTSVAHMLLRLASAASGAVWLWLEVATAIPG